MTTRRPSRFAQPGGRPPFDKTIQVAGVASYAEARMLLDCGVDYLGFPFRLSVHREDITERDAREIIRRVGAARAVAITYVDTARDARDLLETLGAAAIQLHGPIDVTEIALLRRACPNVAFIKSIVISPDEVPDVEELIRGYEPHVDAFITDTYDPVSGASGATGKVHDWAVSDRIVRSTKRRVILAGGLRPDNVAAAIRRVRPSAVDVHTGVEAQDGCKSKRLTEQFVAAARAAFAMST